MPWREPHWCGCPHCRPWRFPHQRGWIPPKGIADQGEGKKDQEEREVELKYYELTTTLLLITPELLRLRVGGEVRSGGLKQAGGKAMDLGKTSKAFSLFLTIQLYLSFVLALAEVDRFKFFHRSQHEVVLWICAENSVNNAKMFLLVLSSTYLGKRHFLCLILPHQ